MGYRTVRAASASVMVVVACSGAILLLSPLALFFCGLPPSPSWPLARSRRCLLRSASRIRSTASSWMNMDALLPLPRPRFFVLLWSSSSASEDKAALGSANQRARLTSISPSSRPARVEAIASSRRRAACSVSCPHGRARSRRRAGDCAARSPRRRRGGSATIRCVVAVCRAQRSCNVGDFQQRIPTSASKRGRRPWTPRPALALAQQSATRR
jgi:hypothetical protein